jgi:hypothetical protein
MAAPNKTPPQYTIIHSNSGQTQTGVGKSMMTMGLTGVQVSVALSGPKATRRTSTGDVVFLFQFNPPPAPAKRGNQQPPDIAAAMAQSQKDHQMPMGLKSPDSFSLIRATLENDTRHLDLGSQGGKKILGGGRRPKDAVEFSVEKLGPDTFRVKPKSPLGPGEYAFALTQGSGEVWDFGVDGK